ncbi:ATP-binding cassette sub-family G member 1 isoform X1 [Cotesia typhae]|uniref:ATP-binding cassette sub-family G member 1 isoform X1 n=1 Tax=Cotesia typhae TaxID=2053667 RepID=UPI003D684D98
MSLENDVLLNQLSMNGAIINIGSIKNNLLVEKSIDFKHLSYSVCVSQKGKCTKEILRDVCGHFRACSLNTIIGPSGAGKTSLLSSLCGFKSSNLRGSIRVNGIQVNSDHLRKLTCYIPQNFELLPMLTTKETLYFATRLKVHKSTGRSFGDVVNEVAENLGLQECLSTMAANLSGGKKKRLSIGVEIVSNPQVLILDEPTSGLDSASSYQVMSLLRKLSQEGCTIICSIHQPSSQIVTLIDNILVLADGQDLYCGPRVSLVETFEQAGFACPFFYNICEFVIEVATGQQNGDRELVRKISSNFHSAFNKSVRVDSNDEAVLPNNDLEDKEDEEESSEKQCKISSRINELDVLLWRAAICIRRDNAMTKLRLTVHIVVGLLLGLVFRDFGKDASKTPSNIASYFFFILFLFFSTAMPALQMFPIESAVFIREYLNNWYGLCTYYLSKIITDLPLQILCPTCFLITAYWLTGQPLEWDRFMKVWIICFLISMLAQSFGVLAGALFDPQIGCFIVPALNIPLLLFAGFFIKFSEMSSYFYPVSAISFYRYAFEGIMQAVYGNDRAIVNCDADFCILRKPKIILSYMDMPSTTFPTIICILCGWIVFLHAFIYMILRWRIANVLK